MKTVNNILELIGDTPIVKLENLTSDNDAEVYVKVESFNPTRSIKARTALNMIETAEKKKQINSKTKIIEPTSGNTGIGIAMIAAAKGYNALLIMPETVSIERIKQMKAYGAEIILTDGDTGMQGAIKKAKDLVEEIDNSLMLDQFNNPANPDIHRKTTAKEIKKVFGDNLDILVSTAGTGGTVSGTGEELKKYNPELEIYIVESENSPVISGGNSGNHQIPGTGPGFIPQNLNTDIYNRIYRINDEDALETARLLASQEGLLVGPSSGASVHTALQAAKEKDSSQKILAIAPDTGERYLSTKLFEVG